jgi:opacity protein-like surface antigen
MMKSRYLFIFLIAADLLLAQYKSNVSNVATTAAPFLQIGVGSRAIGMGGAFVATANDASAMYWNPAGLGKLNSAELIFVHTSWLADISFDYAGAILPLGKIGTLGASITMLNMGQMEVRTVDMQNGTGEFFNASDLALTVSYGFSLTDRFALGLNVKYLLQRIWKESAQGFAIDIGTIYQTGITGLRIGAALTNFGTDMQMAGDDLLVYHDIDPNQSGNNDRLFAQLQTQSWPLPLNFQLGLAMDIIQNPSHRLTLATDAIHPIDNQESIHLGSEYALMERYFLRLGYRNLFLQNNEAGLTLGGGISMALLGNFRISVDYAYADFGRLQNAQRFSINLRF